jgi:luciferase family oxidoreductase group 1
LGRAPGTDGLTARALHSAQLAAALGLPFAFASHFAPDLLQQAASLYRARFRPSEQLARPSVMLGLNVFAAETDAAARRLFTSVQQAFANLRRGEPGPLPPPVDSMEGRWSPTEKATAEHALRYAIVGSAETVRRGLEQFVEQERPDEIMATAMIFDHAARLRSFEILAGISSGA